MCLVCDELATSAHWAEVWPGEDRETRLGQHHARLAAIRDVLGHARLRVDMELGGSAYLVGDAKGRAVVCRNLDALWAAADELAGAPLDPLDPSLLDALGRARCAGGHG